MNTYAAYPDAAEVENIMRSTRLWPTDPNQIARARRQAEMGANAGVGHWERVTGSAPFLAVDDVATPREYEGSDINGFLDFEGGALRIESVSIGERVLTANQFRSWPLNAVSRGGAILGLRMNTYAGSFGGFGADWYLGGNGYGMRPLITVNAVWGRVNAIPGDVFQAIAQYGARIALSQIENTQSIASISQDGFNKALDIVGILSQKDLADVWGKDFKEIIAPWRRMILPTAVGEF